MPYQSVPKSVVPRLISNIFSFLVSLQCGAELVGKELDELMEVLEQYVAHRPPAPAKVAYMPFKCENVSRCECS